MKFIVDGNNVCYWREDREFSFPLLLELLIQLRKRGDTFICFFDANIERILSDLAVDQDKVRKLLKEHIQYFKTVPAGNRADDYIIITANRYGASIITNDRFENEQSKKYASNINWLSQKTESQRLYKGQVMYFGMDFGEEWVLMLPDLGIEVVIEDNANKKLIELLSLLKEETQSATPNITPEIPKKTQAAATVVVEQTPERTVEPELPPAKRHIGRVIVLQDDKGFGFLTCEEFPDNIYFKLSEVVNKDLMFVGSEISFELSSNIKGVVAINICGRDEQFVPSPKRVKNIPYITEIENLQNTGEYITPSIKVLGKVDLSKFEKKRTVPEADTTKERPQFKPSYNNNYQPNYQYSEKNLGDVASELNASVFDLSSFLNKQGYRTWANPNYNVSDEQYRMLVGEFGGQVQSPFSKRYNDFYTPEEVYEWWTGLNDAWQKMFMRVIEVETPPTIKELIKIVNLVYLDCKNEKLDTLEPLRRLSKLKVLICDNTSVNSLKPLEGLSSLEKLNCSRNDLDTLEPLKYLYNLKYLYCDNTKIDTIAPLMNLKKLKVLDCGHNGIGDINICQYLPNLTELFVYETQVKSLEPLRHHPAIEELWCYNTLVDTLEPMGNKPRLKMIDISNAKVENVDVVKFQEDNNFCEIYF